MKLELDEKTAREIYPGAADALKTILIKNFGANCFRKKDWNDFESFDDLCRAIGTTEEEFNAKWDPTLSDPSTIAFEKLKICTRAYNQDWNFNTYDTNQRKWYPWFTVSSSGLGFSGSYYYYGNASSDVGSRLCFKDEPRSNHAGKTFIKLFEDFITAKY